MSFLGKSFESELKLALSLDLTYPERPPQKKGKPAAVLVLFGVNAGKISLLFVRRAEGVQAHAGQMAFPGGVCEAEELAQVEGEKITALRETWEETGIPPEQVEVLGQLPPLWTVTDFWVTPSVAVLKVPFDPNACVLQKAEIAEALWIPLEALQSPACYSQEWRRVGAVNYPVHVFQVGEYRIWGATGSMVRNLVDRLEKARASLLGNRS